LDKDIEEDGSVYGFFWQPSDMPLKSYLKGKFWKELLLPENKKELFSLFKPIQHCRR